SYGGGVRDHINYISFLQMNIAIDDKRFLTSEDFEKNGIELVSKYHTKHVMSYDWKYETVDFSLKFFLPRENSLACLVEMKNSGEDEKNVFIHATNVYGLWEIPWWGSDGLAARYSRKADASVSKIWAYGDVFVLGSNLKSIAHKSTGSEKQWEKWLCENDMSCIEGTSIHGLGPMRTIQTYKLTVPSKGLVTALFYLSRGRNEMWAIRELKTALLEMIPNLKKQLAKDEEFWSKCPMLEGDWPKTWKHGWVYDWETLRMNIREPIGIYKHHWDAMQVHSPRVVLGETSLDTMMLSYADPDLAKETLYGTFADALMPNVPCSREDGSVNMIAADGSECGTAPNWGFPFHVIRSIYERTLDDEWIKKFYPHLKAFIEWWLQNRTDKDGWFHCKCSWESGQDGSKRFFIPSHDPGGVAEFVRTVDVEASIAEAMRNMEMFAKAVDMPEDQEYWRKLAKRRVKTTQEMFVDGWFRDFDARTNQPLILKDYYDIMMLAPLTCGIATPEQMEAIKPKFQYFKKNPRHWLEWPSFIFPFSEAAWNAGLRMFISEILADIADRIYPRTDARTVLFKDRDKPFSYRVPGVANEFWPLREIPAGGENYGWGATLPINIIRNIIGFRETGNLSETEFFLAPAISNRLAEPGKKYTITNLHYREVTSKVTYEVKDADKIKVTLEYRSKQPKAVTVSDSSSSTVLVQKEKKNRGAISFKGVNGGVYMVNFSKRTR
ncbi:MAG: trehalase family glycosidase, partial [Candidatus Bathyarchaeia archaeon]